MAQPGHTIVETDLLVIGAGPAGAALACFLAQHGRTTTYFIRLPRSIGTKCSTW